MKCNYEEVYNQFISTNSVSQSNIHEYLNSDKNFRNELNGCKKNKAGFLKITVLYFVDLILSFVSIFNLFILKYKRIKVAHYCIEKFYDEDVVDLRSKYIFDKISMKKTVNILHVSNTIKVLKKHKIRHNSLYLESFVRILLPFYGFYSKESRCVSALKLELNVYKYLFKFLKIDVLLCIDDPRNISALCYQAKKQKIKTIGYMHGRFNKYHLGIFLVPFDTYIIYSDYYKDLYIKNVIKFNPQCDTRFLYAFENKYKLQSKYDANFQNLNILIVEEDDVSLSSLQLYLEVLSKTNYNIYFRNKPGNFNSNFIDIVNKYKVTPGSNKEFVKAVREDNINIIIGNHSTTLYESICFNIVPIKIDLGNDYGNHMIEENFIPNAQTPIELLQIIDEIFNGNINIDFKEIYEKIWGIDIDYAIDSMGVNEIFQV